MLFEKIKQYYEKGIYKKSHLQALTEAGAITADEYELITGEAYAGESTEAALEGDE